MGDISIEEARARMIAKRFNGNDKGASTGGGGSARRKKKAAHKTPNTDDKKLGATLKKLGVTNIPAIEEVNIFKDSGEVLHFKSPKVQASIAANTFVISGAAETKTLQDMLPGIVNQLGADNLPSLRQFAENMSAAGAANAAKRPAAIAEEPEEDDDIPDLVDNFEEVSNK